MGRQEKRRKQAGITRRELMLGTLAGGVIAASGAALWRKHNKREWKTEASIARAAKYEADIASVIYSGLRELRVTPGKIKGKKILLKPNLVETSDVARHINTHPLVVRGAAEGPQRLRV